MEGKSPIRARLARLHLAAPFTILALACSSSNRLIPPASPTATPSRTATVSPTASPSPSPTPTAASSPSPPSEASGAYIRKRPDGSTTYVDLDLGYAATFPPAWVIIELTAEDVAEALKLAAEAYPGIESLFDLAALGSENIRMMAFNLQPAILIYYEPPSVNISAETGSRSVSIEFLLLSTEQILPQILPGTEVISTEVRTNAHGVKLGFIESLISLESGDQALDRHVLQAYFKITEGLVIFSAEAREDVFDKSAFQFAAVLDSIVLSNGGSTPIDTSGTHRRWIYEMGSGWSMGSLEPALRTPVG